MRVWFVCMALALFALFITRPSQAITDCAKVNQPEYCEILNAE